MEWEKIFTNHSPDKGIVYKIYKKLKQLLLLCLLQAEVTAYKPSYQIRVLPWGTAHSHFHPLSSKLVVTIFFLYQR
jgi:hypothetical protein